MEVDQGSFCPLIFSCTGGMGTEAKNFYERMTTKISEKKREKHCQVIRFIRARFRFNILRTRVISPERRAVDAEMKSYDQFLIWILITTH